MPALRVSLPTAIADEIAGAARRCERSVGFLVLGALKSATALGAAPPRGDTRPLDLETDDDDPKDLASRVKKLAAERGKGLSFDDAVAAAWTARRAQILAWVDRAASVNESARADDLDEALAAAANPKTPATRLVELAKSVYPRVRVIVAGRKDAPAEALAILARDREPRVRKTLEERAP
jgi:hypothetical protein